MCGSEKEYGDGREEAKEARRIRENPVRNRTEEAKLRGLASSFYRTDSRLELLQGRGARVDPVTQIPIH